MMSSHRGGGGGSSRGGGAALDFVDREQLRKMTDVATRQLRKLRKYELEQVCNVAQIPSTGLKAALVSAISTFLQGQHSVALTSAGAVGQAAWQTIVAVTDKISQGYADVLQKRSTPTHSHAASSLKLDASAGGYAAGYGTTRGAGGGIRWDQDIVDDVMLRSKQDPFYEVTETLSGPVQLEKGSGAQNTAVLNFNLSFQKLQLIRDASSPGNSAEGRRNHVVLRCYKLSTGGGHAAVGKEGETGGPTRGHIWPLETVCQVNKAFMQLKQRKVFFQGTARKLKGDCAPQDIGHTCAMGHNVVELYSPEPEPYAVIIQLVRLVEVDEVFRGIKEQPYLTKEQALQRVKNSFRGSLEVDVDMAQEEDSDDDLMATATRLSLRCPLGLVPITCPGRGRHCKHLQCFDLRTFLSFNKNCAGAGWKCGVCNMLIKPGDLVVDTYLDEVVRTLREQGRLAEVEEVEIQNDGGWEPLVESQKPGKNNRRDKKKTQSSTASSSPTPQQEHECPVSAGERDAEDGDEEGDDGTFDGDNVEWNSLLAGPTNENGPAGTSSRGSSGDGGEGGADGESGINENGGAGEGNANSAADDLPYVVDLSIESDEDDGPAAAPQPPASRCRSSSTTATSPSTQMSLSQQRANGVAIGGGSGSGGSAGGARGSTEATLLHHPNSSPTDSLGSTDDSGDNSSSTPPVAGGSCGGATGGGTQHSSKLSSACASGAVRGKERAAAAALGGVAGATAPSHFIGNSGGGSGMRASSTPSQMNALRRAKNASGMGMAIDSGGAMGGEASGGGREGSAGFWNDNPLVSYTTGYANPVAGGAGGGAGAAAASHLTSGGTSSNRSGDRRSQSTGWPMSPRGQLDIRRDGQRYQPQHPSFSGDAPFGSGEALIGYGGGGEGTGRRGMNGAGWGAFAGGGGHGAIGWQSGMVGMGGGGSGPSQSLKRPRSSSQSDDYQDGRPRQMPLLGHLSTSRQQRHGGGHADGQLLMDDELPPNGGPNYDAMFDHRGGDDGRGAHGSGDGGRGGDGLDPRGAGGGFWGDPILGLGGDHHASELASGGGWDDDILRKLEGLGDPIG